MHLARYRLLIVRGPLTGKGSVRSVAGAAEINASSAEGFDDAIQPGVARASKTLKHVKKARIQSQEGTVDSNGQISEYRVQLKSPFILQDQPLSPKHIPAPRGACLPHPWLSNPRMNLAVRMPAVPST